MLERDKLDATIRAIGEAEGLDLNGQERLMIRNGIARTLTAQKRRQQRENAAPYEWKKPERLRR